MDRKTWNAAFMTDAELAAIGITDASQRNIRIHKTAVLVETNGWEFGHDIRIDPMVVISCADLRIGRHVHVAVGGAIIGAGAVRIGDFANLSGGVRVYTSNDDYSGKSLTNPMVPSEMSNVHHAPVRIGAHAILGANAVVLPGTDIGDGVALGAFSLASGELEPWTVYAGIPAKRIKERKRDCELLGERLLGGSS